jgi:hypothetical protein
MENIKQDLTLIEDLVEVGQTGQLEEILDYLELEINKGNQVILVRRPENAPEEVVDILRYIVDVNRYREKYTK